MTMTLNPILLEAIASIGVSIVGSAIVAPIAFVLKQAVRGRERTVVVRLPSGKEVRLELDAHLSAEATGDLVAAAVSSAQSGDEAAVERAVAASHDASREARLVASDN